MFKNVQDCCQACQPCRRWVYHTNILWSQGLWSRRAGRAWAALERESRSHVQTTWSTSGVPQLAEIGNLSPIWPGVWGDHAEVFASDGHNTASIVRIGREPALCGPIVVVGQALGRFWRIVEELCCWCYLSGNLLYSKGLHHCPYVSALENPTHSTSLRVHCLARKIGHTMSFRREASHCSSSSQLLKNRNQLWSIYFDSQIHCSSSLCIWMWGCPEFSTHCKADDKQNWPVGKRRGRSPHNAAARLRLLSGQLWKCNGVCSILLLQEFMTT